MTENQNPLDPAQVPQVGGARQENAAPGGDGLAELKSTDYVDPNGKAQAAGRAKVEALFAGLFMGKDKFDAPILSKTKVMVAGFVVFGCVAFAMAANPIKKSLAAAIPVSAEAATNPAQAPTVDPAGASEPTPSVSSTMAPNAPNIVVPASEAQVQVVDQQTGKLVPLGGGTDGSTQVTEPTAAADPGLGGPGENAAAPIAYDAPTQTPQVTYDPAPPVAPQVVSDPTGGFVPPVSGTDGGMGVTAQGAGEPAVAIDSNAAAARIVRQVPRESVPVIVIRAPDRPPVARVQSMQARVQAPSTVLMSPRGQSGAAQPGALSSSTPDSSRIMFRGAGSGQPTQAPAVPAADAFVMFSGAKPSAQSPGPAAGVVDAPPGVGPMPYALGTVLKGTLATGVIAVPDREDLPVIIACDDGSTWIGKAKIDAARRVRVVVTEVVVKGVTYKATGMILAPDGLPGLPAEWRTEAPSVYSDVLQAAVGGASSYVKGLADARSITTNPSGGTTVSSQAPSFGWSVLGNVSNLFQVPTTQRSVVTFAQVGRGTKLLVSVLPAGAI